MKRFLIHVSTYWCGMDDTFRAVAESEMELWDLAEQLAYDNFQSYSCENDIAEEEGYDPDEMEESDWDELWSRREYLLQFFHRKSKHNDYVFRNL